jgi:hypothetical protein
MTVHRDRYLVTRTNRCTEFQFLLVIISLHVSGSLSAHHQELLSRTTALVQFVQLGDRVLPGSGRKFRPDPGSTQSPSCTSCTSAVVRLRNSWWWAERLPETCRFIITNKNWNSVHLLVLFTRNLSRCTVIQSKNSSMAFAFGVVILCALYWPKVYNTRSLPYTATFVLSTAGR